jgi:peptidoglycan/xylan/chitin deacetylase (PgdA/CDA1 family)
MSALIVIMYHYVRPLADSAYPGIKGLELSGFLRQLDWLKRQGHAFVRLEEVVEFVEAGRALPEKPVLLTFDDGYLDHYEHVFPELRRRGLSGVFFAPVDAVREHRMLDVNKIHFVLASGAEPRALIAAIEDAVEKNRAALGLRSAAEYRAELMKANEWDSAEVIYVKRMLQHALPIELRARLVSALFGELVSTDEAAFARTVYLSVDQLREMRAGGMSIGGHGKTHRWLNTLSRAEQREEIRATREFLLGEGLCDPAALTFCYPYGGHDDETVELLVEAGFRLGFIASRAQVAKKDARRMLLPRFDTNHFPKG